MAVARASSLWLSRAPHSCGVEDARAFLAANAGPAKRVRAIIDGEGFAGIVGTERELGFWIARRTWGRGYATRAFLDPAAAGGGLMSGAVDAFAAFVFARFPVTALRAGVFTDTPASARVLEKIGFVLGGEGLAHSAQRLEPAPVWKYRLSRQAFLA